MDTIELLCLIAAGSVAITLLVGAFIHAGRGWTDEDDFADPPSMIWVLAVLLAAFCIVGKIDYESQVAMSSPSSSLTGRSFHDS